MIVRKALTKDTLAMTLLLNEIIAIGGTTAHQDPMSQETVQHYFVDGAPTICCIVAEQEGQIIGWQAVGWWREEPHIGSFVKPGIQAKGVGAQMFALTRDLAKAAGLTVIHASIRADNVPGLAYYAKMGFADYATDPHFTLNDGTVVGRIERRFDLV